MLDNETNSSVSTADYSISSYAESVQQKLKKTQGFMKLHLPIATHQ